MRCEANNANNDGQQLEGNEAFNLTNKSESSQQTDKQLDSQPVTQSVIQPVKCLTEFFASTLADTAL